MILQRMHHILGGTPSIVVNQASFTIGWEWRSRDYFSLDVTPNNMAWTTTIEDTGDGTSWASCTASGVGDKWDPNISIGANEENDTGADRFCNIRFSDDSGDAADVVIQIMQEVNPV